MKNTNLLKSVSFLFFVICSTLQGWGATATVGITTTMNTAKDNTNTARTVSGATNLTVTHQLNSGTSGALATYGSSDKEVYYASETANYSLGSYKWNVDTSGADIISANNYVGYSVSIASGYKYSLSNLTFQIAGSANFTYKLMIYNSSGTAIYTGVETSVTNYKKESATNYSQSITLSDNNNVQNLTGTFYVRVYLKCSGKGKYLCFPTFTITGDLAAASAYYYRGDDNEWGATAMTISTGGMYEYIASTSSSNKFKIALAADSWDYNKDYNWSGFFMTDQDINLGDYGGDDCYIWDAPASYYIIVFKPNTSVNSSSNPHICVSTSLPDDSPSGLAATKTVYLDPGVWEASSAKYAICYVEHNGEWSGFMTASPCFDGIYQTTIPAWVSNVEFVRFNSTATDSDISYEGGKCWNYSGHLSSMPSGAARFTVSQTGATWSDLNTSNWSTPAHTTYTISYAKGSTTSTGGNTISGSKDSESKTCGVDFTLPSSAVFTTTGYTQTGWATSDGGSQAYALGGSYTTNAAQAFYPVWTLNSHTLTWALNGGTVTVAGTGAAVNATGSPSTSVNYGTAITAPTVTRTGYTFSSWNTTPASTMPDANTTYTAQWMANQYSVSITPTNATKLIGATGANAATYGTNYTATFRRVIGYNLPTTISVTIGGNSATSGTDYTWTQATGTLTIPGTKITGNIGVTLSGTAVTCPDGSSEETLFSLSSVGSGYSNSSNAETELTDITVSGGFAYGYGTSSRALEYSNNKIKYNGGVNYIKLVLDCDLQPGDVISFSCDANTGLNFNSTGTSAGGTPDYATGALNGSTYTVVADDGLDGENTIYCWRRTGNATNVTAITITRPVTCTAGAPGSIIKGEASGGTGSINLTVSGSPASGDTWYWQTSASGTDKTRSTASAYAVSSPGTYYLRSYNTSSDCWSFTTRSVTVAADDLLTAITPTLSYDSEVAVDGTINPTLTGNLGSGTVTYSLNSVTPTGGLTIDAGTGAVTGVTAGATATVTATITANGNYKGGSATSSTITVADDACFRFVSGTKKDEWTNIAVGSQLTTSDYKSGATLTGGTITNSGSSALQANNTNGIIFLANQTNTVTIALTGSHALDVGSVITINAYATDGSSAPDSYSSAHGFVIGGINTATTEPGSSKKAFTVSYTVPAESSLIGKSSFTLTNQTAAKHYVKSIIVTGCQECTSISPTLSAETANLYSFPVATSTTLTFDKDGSTGDVEWSVSPSGVVSVSGSGTEVTVTAIAAGTATVTAFITSDGDHCAKSVTKEFTVVGDCGYNVIAGVTRTSGSKTEGTTSGSLVGDYGINVQANGKLGSDGHYIYLVLSSGNYYQNGDSVYITLNTVNSGTLTIQAGGKVPGTTLATLAKASLSADATNKLILSNVPANTDTITIFRTSSNQNHQIDAITVKRYVCPENVFEFNNANYDGLWSTEENWVGEAGQTVASLPTTSDRVIVTKPITVDITDAQASEVILDQSSSNTGSLVISAGQELIVASTVKVWNGSSLAATGVNDIVFNSDASNGLGALVMGSHDGTNKATVNFYTLSHGSSGSGASVNQYVGTPFNDENNILHNWYNSWVYGITYDGSGNIGWTRINAGSGMTPFYGYTVISADAAGHSYWQQGTLVASTDQTLSGLNWQSGVGTANGNNENLLANSWMAPIYIKAMETTDFVNTDATVYIFISTSPDDFKSGGFAGNYTTYTVNTTSDDVIPAMQSFSVFTNATGGSSVTLDYSKIVYEPAVAGDAVPEANKAPHRENGTAGEADKLRLYVRAASGYGDMLYLWEQDGLSEGFDNGWDGRKMFGEPVAPQLYAVTPDGNMAINCVPDWEGTVLGFRKGTEDNTYTFTFEYEGEQTWYLNDMKEETSTRIMSENSYLFSTADGDSEARFIISATPISKVTTDIGEAGCLPSAVRKMVIDNHVYIIRNGRMYDATGVMMR